MTTRLEGFKNRQKDTGWCKAFCHIIPFYFIYYGITRRTITPMLYSFLGNLVLGFSFISTPLLAKRGIDQVRKNGKSQLE